MTPQIGFRPGYQTCEGVAQAQFAMEQAKVYGLSLAVGKIDISKAFDSSKHVSLMEAILDRVPSKRLGMALARELDGMDLQVNINTKQSASWCMEKGVRQGTPDSGMTFEADLDAAVAPTYHEWRYKGYGFPLKWDKKQNFDEAGNVPAGTDGFEEQMLSLSLCADDITIFASSHSQLQQQFTDMILAL